MQLILQTVVQLIKQKLIKCFFLPFLRTRLASKWPHLIVPSPNCVRSESSCADTTALICPKNVLKCPRRNVLLRVVQSTVLTLVLSPNLKFSQFLKYGTMYDSNTDSKSKQTVQLVHIVLYNVWFLTFVSKSKPSVQLLLIILYNVWF